MRTVILTLAMLFICAGNAAAQGFIRIPIVTTVPAKCSPAQTGGQAAMVWKKSGANRGLHECTATDTWTYRGFSVAGTLTANAMVYISASNVLSATAAATDGQILIGRTGDIPVLGQIAGTANEITVSNSAGAITLSLATMLVHAAGTRFILTDISDPTKRFQFLAGSITTGQTRSVTIPDANTTLPVFSQQATFTGPTAARSYALPDDSTTLAHGTGTANALAKFSDTGTGQIEATSNVTDNGSTVEIAVAANRTVVIGGVDPSGVEITNDTTSLGDWDGVGNNTRVAINDNASAITIRATSGTTFEGPIRTSGAGTFITFINSATASLNYAQAGANSCETLTLALSNALDGDVVTIGIPHTLANHNTTATFFGWVSDGGEVSVRRCVISADGSDPAAATVRAQITQF